MTTSETEQHKKLCMARKLYRCIDDPTPSCERNMARNTRAKLYTWRDWWLEHYGEDYNAYIAKLPVIKKEVAA